MDVAWIFAEIRHHQTVVPLHCDETLKLLQGSFPELCIPTIRFCFDTTFDFYMFGIDLIEKRLLKPVTIMFLYAE